MKLGRPTHCSTLTWNLNMSKSVYRILKAQRTTFSKVSNLHASIWVDSLKKTLKALEFFLSTFWKSGSRLKLDTQILRQSKSLHTFENLGQRNCYKRQMNHTFCLKKASLGSTLLLRGERHDVYSTSVVYMVSRRHVYCNWSL